MRCRGARWHGGVRVDSRITDGAVNAPDVDEESDLEEPCRCACFAGGERGTEALPRWARLVPRRTPERKTWCRGELRERLGAGDSKERKTYSMCLKPFKDRGSTTLINKQTHKHHLPSAAHRSSRSRHTARRSLPLARALSLSAMDLNVSHIVTLRTAPGACECDSFGCLSQCFAITPPPTKTQAPPDKRTGSSHALGPRYILTSGTSHTLRAARADVFRISLDTFH